MILRIASLILVLCFVWRAKAQVSPVAPEITVIEEGFNVVAKIPCVGCPFLFQDTSKGKDEAWSQREDRNALVFINFINYV
jgi:hypothetical protein